MFQVEKQIANSARRCFHTSQRLSATVSRSVLPEIKNEPCLTYAPGSKERAELRAAIERLKNQCPDIPCLVGGKEIRTGDVHRQVKPTEHSHTLCTFHMADEATLLKAAKAAVEAKQIWENWSFEDRAAVFLKAADLLSTKYRADLCAAVMLGQGKNVWQAEIDAAAEVIDFWRFNCLYAKQIYETQPLAHSPGVWNRMEYRPLEGFVLAITPFNFIAIGSNLHSAPAIMGNTSLWKPATTTILGSYIIYQILREAGLPDGVLNFIPARGSQIGKTILPLHDLAGVHFTGSTDTFAVVWQTISDHLRPYYSYPRVVGETGGKNFHFVHSSAHLPTAVHNTVRSAFEYQGQKCSACSRLYVPSDLWPKFRELMLDDLRQIKMGDVEDFSIFMASVVDKSAYNDIIRFIEIARSDPNCEIIHGGKYSDEKGYFIEPTVILTKDPKCVTMCEEIFGPVLTVFVYDQDNYEAALRLCDNTSKYGLTGAVFAQDRSAIIKASNILRYSAGNFYINDKCTGAVVAQQPFGGGRGSGTNDKSGSVINLMRWVSTRTVKENFLPLNDFKYPSMLPEN